MVFFEIVEHVDPMKMQDEMNARAADGWQLVQFTTGQRWGTQGSKVAAVQPHPTYIAVFRRE